MDALNEYLLPGKDDANVDGLGLDSSNSDSCKDESVRGDELHEMLVPATLREPWTYLENPVKLNSYYIEFSPDPNDRIYKKFGLFVKAPLPVEAERMEVDLHLARGRSVMTKLVPSGLLEFDKDEIVLAQNFQEMYLKIILDRSEFIPLGKNDICKSSSSTFYLLLPVILHDHGSTITVDWEIVIRCLSSPVFKTSEDDVVKEHFPLDDHLQLANGCRSISDVENSLVYVQQKKEFFFITNKSDTLTKKQRRFGIQLKYPGQPLLHAKPLFRLHNLLHNRKSEDSESREPEEEYFIDLPPELCQLKIIGFSKDMGSSISLLPSIMHRLENLLVAIQLKHTLSAAFPEGAELTCDRVLEALTTEKCQEGISLERLEILGDAFLKFAVGRHLFLLHDALDEGELTRKRADIVNNANLYSLAIRCNLQVYIRDNPFDPCQFFALGHPCLVICNKETEGNIHSRPSSSQADHASSNVVRCSKGHHWLQKKTIADVVEALVGAFIVDSGFNAAISFLRWIGIQVDFEASHVVNACKSSTSYIPLAARLDIAALKNNLLGYQFHHIGLLIQAFVHPSYNNNRGGSYQRLEFLGDAALDYLITSYLYSVYPKLKPGELTDLRSAFVNNKTFANVAVDRSFHKYLISNSSDLTEAINTYVDSIKTRAPEGSLIDGPKCPKALGDLVESCLGAILLDTGFNLDLVWTIALSFLDAIMRSFSLQVSPIREIHELCQAYNLNLRFSASKNGTLYMVEAQVNGTDVCITASAVNLNKKEAMRIASQEIFSKLKAKGYIPKSKTLEEVLKSSYRMEAKLIGYDEKPIDVNTHDAIGFEKLMAQSFSTDSVPQIPPVTKVSDNSISCITPVIKKPFGALRGQPSGTIENHSCDPDSQTAGGSHKGTARSRLHEICVANSWKPSFECCGEEGPSHSKLFSFKVVVEKKEAPVVVLVCFGAPRLKKKDAAEDAAEGALWYLKREGYLPESN